MEITYASPSSLDLAASSSSASAASSSASAMPHSNRPVKVIPLQHPTTSSSPLGQSFLSDAFNKRIEILKRMTWIEWIEMVLPCFRWIRTYNYREYLQVDLMAGITVGVMLVPQAMSYAKLAGLQPIYGLYSGFVPIFVYTILGHLANLQLVQ
ncbi:hypothetical protein LWI29_018756 [Acer saccharum]|uniref:SLC26A/SulP transporter domain-containing protein n=1 Tax=Acer saccharum TaxID=4024 RepID=A0AA39SKK4_ACESA|nr:hypothetical protein LWI29_018756 [Acer saccharum]